MNYSMELVWDLYGLVCMDFFYGYLLEVWNTSFCVDFVFEMVVWFDCGPQWRKNLYREKVGF